MKNKFDFLPNLNSKAKTDLKEIWEYTKYKWSVNQANKYIDDIRVSLTKLCENPQISANYREVNGVVFYFKKINHHYIVYQLIKSEINIYRILHEKMDFIKHLKK